MNKSGPDSSESARARDRQSAGVVASFKGSRRSISKVVPSAEETAQLSALSKSIVHLPEIDAAKVVELHRRIMAGEYEIDSEKLAAKIIGLENELEP